MERIQKELYKKDLKDPCNHGGVVTHPEPHILEYEVKWALGSTATNKASGGDVIPVELFKILKDDTIKVLHSMMSTNLENLAVSIGLKKVNIHPSSQEEQ